MKALYRLYRPKSLAEVVGQPQVTAPLESALASGRISHAYLFTGPRGCGKTSVARIFAHAINHFPYELEDNYVDIIEIDAASNTGVDNIRDLREKAAIAPTQGQYKVYIIDEVHMLSKSAFNALLKTLEEPPTHVVFLLATTDLDKVPVTITSRTQVFHFRLAPPDVLVPHLEHIAKQAQIPIDPPALTLIAEQSGGSFRDALSLLDQISTLASASPDDGHANLITADQLKSALRLPDATLAANLLEKYQSADLPAIAAALESTLEDGTNPLTLAENLIQAIVKTPTPVLLPLLDALTKVAPPFAEAKLLLALTENLKKSPETPNSTQTPTPVSSTPTPVTQNTPHPPIIPQNSKKVNPQSTSSEVRGVADGVFSQYPEVTTASSKVASGEGTSLLSRATAEAVPEGEDKREPPVTTGRLDAVAKNPVSDPGTPVSDTPDASTFSWPSYLTKIKSSSSTLHSRLQKCPYRLLDTTLHLYPEKSIDKTIFTHKNNYPLLLRHLAPLRLEIHEIDEFPPDEDPANLIASTTTASPTQTATAPNPKTADTTDPVAASNPNATPKTPPKSKKNTSPIPQISAIMGRGIKEVTQNDGEIPF